MVKLYLRSKILLCITFFVFISGVSFSQQRIITGKVTAADDGGEIPGTSIRIKNTSIITLSDSQGRYSISASPGSVLVFSFLGFNTLEYVVKDNNVINAVLVTSVNSLNEVVVTGLTSQKKSDVTAAISSISGRDILKSPVTNVTNALMGRVPGLIATQLSGRPGKNQSELYIRGRVSSDSKALIVVDGIERESFGDIDPNEIETITVLKDAASTALYGIKGANGVFVITTKNGIPGVAKISFTSNVGIQSYKQLPGILPSYESAMLHNEGQINIGVPAANRTFTDQDLQIFKDGTGDPLLYPNVNWYKALTRPNWFQTQNNVNISGGSKVAKYFASVGHTFEDGIFKNFATRSNFKTTPDYNRYNFRSNVFHFNTNNYDRCKSSRKIREKICCEWYFYWWRLQAILS
ncbi:MAG TPA: TonB-dependent receptor plug domain-containing protein [Sphingobacteriaceae bacterium]|nr:TonB-dependent receptor plug domain-containing protein [Sphingobacteriaceae bacterium]